MTPVFSFIAYSNTGKTTYIENLIACLKGRGLRVGAIKHDGHRLSIDAEGKDSWRFARAGADVVAVSDADKCAVMEYRPLEFEDIVARMRDVDIILCEGWHTNARNIIGIFRQASGGGLKPDIADCLAVVSDTAMDSGAVPVFPLDDPEPLAEFLIARI